MYEGMTIHSMGSVIITEMKFQASAMTEAAHCGLQQQQ
jgi:hypothetical protein